MRKCLLCYGENADEALVCRWCEQELPPVQQDPPPLQEVATVEPQGDSSILESFIQEFIASENRTDLQKEHHWQKQYAGKAIAVEGRVYSCDKYSSWISLHVDVKISRESIMLTMRLPLSWLNVALSLNKGDRVFVKGVLEERQYSNWLSLVGANVEKR